MPSRPWLRWLVPLAALLAVVATTLIAGNASADEKLPPRSAEQLLVDLQQARVDGFSGTVEQSADLGIPALPGVSEHGSDVRSLISGSHTLRVAYDGPDKSKVALLGDLSESSITRNGDEVWTWSSRENAVTRTTIDPDSAHRDPATEDLPADVPKTPQEAAARFLAAVDDSTTVTTDSDVTVAGRAAYELVLQPKDTRSLISSVRIAVDGTERVATRVQVFAGDRPAPVASIGFTAVDFTAPPPSTFEFSPPPGAEVTEVDPDRHDKTKGSGDETPDREKPTVVGEGWTTVVVATLPENPDQIPTGENSEGVDLQSYLAQLPAVSGPWGSGRLLAGTAFSVVLTDDGRVAAGAVAPELLYDALG